MRDKIIVRLANFVLRFATQRYRDMVHASVEYGLRSAARDVAEGRPAPPSWGELIERKRDVAL